MVKFERISVRLKTLGIDWRCGLKHFSTQYFQKKKLVIKRKGVTSILFGGGEKVNSVFFAVLPVHSASLKCFLDVSIVPIQLPQLIGPPTVEELAMMHEMAANCARFEKADFLCFLD